ncbi:MAG: amidohydrolase family protein [Planctomycetes bacterium]|nr:amidohydrolase family protein [Planctomycetota bacterium]
MVALAPFAHASPPQSVAADSIVGEGADGEERFVVVLTGNTITITGKEIANGVIVIADGKVRNVGRNLEYPKNAKVIDARDRTVMPGLISAHSRYGLGRYNRSGVRGHLSAAGEFFPRDAQRSDLLDAGYTALAIAPAGTGIPGRAVVVRTAGEPATRTLLSPAYLKVSWETPVLRAALEKAKKEIEKIEKARKAFEEKQKKAKKPPKAAKKPGKKPTSQPTTTTAPASQPAFKPPAINKPYQPLVDLIQKKEGLFALIEVRRAADVLHMADVLDEYEIAHAFLLRNRTQTDFYRVVETLGERKARVVLWPHLHRIPYSTERIHVVRALSRAGCEVSAIPASDSAQEHRRILERLAGLVRDGWSREAALQSVTLHPARLLGLEERLGSIEKGKDADLIFLDRDPLDPLARVREVMIAGEIVHEADLRE